MSGIAASNYNTALISQSDRDNISSPSRVLLAQPNGMSNGAPLLGAAAVSQYVMNSRQREWGNLSPPPLELLAQPNGMSNGTPHWDASAVSQHTMNSRQREWNNSSPNVWELLLDPSDDEGEYPPSPLATLASGVMNSYLARNRSLLPLSTLENNSGPRQDIYSNWNLMSEGLFAPENCRSVSPTLWYAPPSPQESGSDQVQDSNNSSSFLAGESRDRGN